MPRPKASSEYPKEYYELFEKAYAVGEVALEFETHSEAHAMREQFYTFRQRLRKVEHPLVEKADELSFNIDGARLTVYLKSPPGVEEIEEALNALNRKT